VTQIRIKLTVMKIINIILTLIFLLFAGWQYNDPDPYIWIPIYLFVAVVCGMAAYKNYATWLTLGGLIVLGIYTLTYVPAFIEWIQMGMPSIVETMKAEKPYVELTREFGGLFIADLALLFQYFRGKKAASN
jgi:Transmembrane family 220, helix